MSELALESDAMVDTLGVRLELAHRDPATSADHIRVAGSAD
jgi:hypothetical protein